MRYRVRRKRAEADQDRHAMVAFLNLRDGSADQQMLEATQGPFTGGRTGSQRILRSGERLTAGKYTPDDR